MNKLLLFFFFLLSSSVFGQQIKGVVKNSLGEIVPFARIGIRNSSFGTVANAEGKFQLTVKKGPLLINVSSTDYITLKDSLYINEDITEYNPVLQFQSLEMAETVISGVSKKDLAKEIMKSVIDQRGNWEDALHDYDVKMYSFSSIEQQIKDSIVTDSVVSKKKMNINEFYSHSYYTSPNLYKDSILGLIDLSEKPRNSVSAGVVIETGYTQDLQPKNMENKNPYLFVQGLKEADINLFKNQQTHLEISQRPIISPLAYNAFIYYSFYLNQSFYREDGKKIYEIQVIPRFKEEALYSGRLFIMDETWELVSAELSVNPSVLNFFKELYFICDYEKNGKALVPYRREFTYLIKEGRNLYNGQIRIRYSDYEIKKTEEKSKFWLMSQVIVPESTDRDSLFWEERRPYPLKTEELLFIHQQDSIEKYYASEEYLKKQDSTYNTLNIWDFTFNGVGFRNSFKKQEWYVNGLINQVVPFGVGGYRHRLQGSYDKEFKNGKTIHIAPTIDYGFRNKDLKGQLGFIHMYNPKRFSKVHVLVGDIYDLVNSYQSIQGTFAPANRVRNKKLEIDHSFELLNGLFLKTGIITSDRQDIGNISYPDWVDAFGTYSDPIPFDAYRVFIGEIDLEYHFRQKYIYKNDRKLIIGSKFPVVNLTYKKGIPGIINSQADFDYLELRVHALMNLGQFGKSEYKLTAGSFLRKESLRIIEHKYFRASDNYFFSNPVNSLQLLDTALNTPNSYLQINFIHHFEGFFLNKVWLINKLKLQETVGGSFLGIPDADFAQFELYVGLERQFRIKKQIFKVGVYAVTADSSFDKIKLTPKIGINFYNSFYKKWDY